MLTSVDAHLETNLRQYNETLVSVRCDVHVEHLAALLFRVLEKRMVVSITKGRHVRTLLILGMSRKDNPNDTRENEDCREDEVGQGRM